MAKGLDVRYAETDFDFFFAEFLAGKDLKEEDYKKFTPLEGLAKAAKKAEQHMYPILVSITGTILN